MVTVIALLYLLMRLIVIGFLTGSHGLSVIKSIPHSDRTNFNPVNDNLISVLLWVRLPRLLEFWSEPILRKVLRPIGKVIQVDVNSEEGSKGLFAQVSMEIDISKPLKWSLNISEMDYSITIL